jgi:polyisoprenoid-binding protein YceI
MSTPATWKLDAMHSHVQFKVKHLVISTVTGEFKDFTAEASASDDSFKDAKISFSAKTASVYTGVDQRDDHLRSADFFDAGQYPEIAFVSSSFELMGTLTIRGTAKPITLQATFGGIAKDGYGQTKAGFELSGKLNRKDYGLVWNALTEAGGAVVSDEVKLIADVQFVKQA